MDRFPVLRDGQTVGEMTVEQENTCTVFRLRCRGEGLFSAWIVGTEGELRLGVPDSQQGTLTMCRRFSRELTSPAGSFVRGELRSCDSGAAEEDWQSMGSPERLFQSGFLQYQLRGVSGALTRRGKGRRYLALPFDAARPFPLVPLFCFARFLRIGGTASVVFAFAKNETPVFEIQPQTAPTT